MNEIQIPIYWYWEAPKELTGLLIAVDTWTATTNLSIILNQKPKRLVIVSETNLLKAKKIYPDAVTIGESHLLAKDNFDIPNLPAKIASARLAGNSVLYMTINGTRIFEKYVDKNQTIIAASFNNLGAIADYVRSHNKATLLLAGDNYRKNMEDRVFSEIINSELAGNKYRWDEIRKELEIYIIHHYRHERDDLSVDFKLVFSRSGYEIIPQGFINSRGFIEVKNLLL